jgi:hypothetical protein
MDLLFIIAAGPRQRSHPQVRVPWDSWPHFTVSYSRLSQPGGSGPRIYIPQEMGGPVIPRGTEFPFRRLLRFAGLRWRYSTPPPHGICQMKDPLRLNWLPGDPNTDHHLEQYVLFCFFRCHETCLPNRWLAMNFHSGSTIPAFRRCLANSCLAMVIFVTIVSFRSQNCHHTRGKWTLLLSITVFWSPLFFLLDVSEFLSMHFPWIQFTFILQRCNFPYIDE